MISQVKKIGEVAGLNHVGVKDPLVGVVTEAQLGINPITGRPQIHPDVLHEMRQYLLIQDEAERKARKLRVQKQVKDLEEDPISQSKFILLEPDQQVNKGVDKGKGVACEEDNQEQSTAKMMMIEYNGNIPVNKSVQNKLMGDAMKAPQMEVKLREEDGDKGDNLMMLPFMIGSVEGKSQKRVNRGMGTSSIGYQTQSKTSSWRRKNEKKPNGMTRDKNHQVRKKKKNKSLARKEKLWMKLTHHLKSRSA